MLQESLYISPHNIGNVDEVPVSFDVVHERTMDRIGIDSVTIDTIGHEKANFYCGSLRDRHRRKIEASDHLQEEADTKRTVSS